MYLEILKINDKLLKEAYNYFPSDYIKLFLDKANFIESLIARYIISKKIEQLYKLKSYKLFNDNTWKPIYSDNIYWSLSHKKDIIFIGIWKKILWVDIEIYKKRDKGLLDKFLKSEYELLWWKNWNNFYILWVAKESIIKKWWWNLDDVWKIQLIKSNDIKKSIDNIVFLKKLTFKFGFKSFNVLLWIKDKLYFWVCI